MKLSTIRAVDYWLGIPLCLILDFFALILSPFIKRGKVKNVLFIELSEAGSLIIGYSAIRRLKEALPNANLYFLIFERHANGLKLLNVIDEEKILTIRDTSPRDFIMDVLSALGKIRRAGIDTVIDMELFSRATSILTLMSLAGNRAGFYAYTNEGLYRGKFIHNYKVAYNPYKHMALNFMALVECVLGNERELPNLKRRLSEEVITPYKLMPDTAYTERGEALIRKVFPSLGAEHRITIINPNAGELPIRAWEIDKFAETAKRILEDDERNLVAIIGLPDAMEDGVYIEKYLNSPRCINLIGMTESLKDVVSLCHVSMLLLTNDSGPAQYASITGAHVVVLFGPETPSLYSPLGDRIHPIYTGFSCSPCVTAANHRNTVCRNNKCLQAITVDEVTGLCVNLLKKEA